MPVDTFKMNEESLLEPMGEISYEDRETAKLACSSTISSSLTKKKTGIAKADVDGGDKQKNPLTGATSSLSGTKKQDQIPEMNETDSTLGLQTGVKGDNENSNSSQSGGVATKPGQPRLIPIEKLMSKNLTAPSSDATSSAAAAALENNNSFITQQATDVQKPVGKKVIEIDFDDYLDLSPEKKQIPTKSINKRQAEEDLLQPMTEIPFEEESKTSKLVIETSKNYEDDEHFFNSGDEFSEIDSSSEFSESDSSDSYTENTKKKRRKKSKIIKESTAARTSGKHGRKRKFKCKQNEIHLDDNINNATFGRNQNPGLKVDNESGGQIIFQNTELTVVNKASKTSSFEDRPSTMIGENAKVFTSDVDILPIGRKQQQRKSIAANANVDVQPNADVPVVRQTQQINSENTEKRYRRKSNSTKPSYYEWSENSMDQVDKPQKTRKPHWKTVQKQKQMRKEAYNNWRAQLQQQNKIYIEKVDPNKNQKENILDTNTLSEPQMRSSEFGPPIENGQTSATKTLALAAEENKLSLNSTSNQPTENVNSFVSTENTTLETTTTVTGNQDDRIGRKRVRKLKYGSYNFTEKRDPNKPKMVLKYKKKYKRKKPVTTQHHQLPLQVELVTGPDLSTSMDASTTNYQEGDISKEGISMQPSTESTETPPVRKKPGPKKGWKLARSQSSKTEPLPTTSVAIKTRLSSAPAPLKSPKIKIEEPAPSQKLKRKTIETQSGSGGSSAEDFEDAELKKKIKRKIRKLDDPSSNNLYLENYNQVLQDRNKVLLEILEQRSAEIRDLKLRVSNLVKNEERPATDTNAEKKESITETDGSWSNAELAKGYSLQKLSRPFYKYVQQKFTIPLPQQSDICKFVLNLRIGKGMQTDILQIMECESETMNDVDRVTVLQISKIQTATIFEYDKCSDSILGKYKDMTVIVARGLYSGWNQAVFIDFKVASIKESLLDVIKQLHKHKYSVVACVCNYVENQIDIWKELDVSMGCNYFSHPITTDFIYAFYYIDDILCSIRQHFLSDGFLLDMRTINATPLTQLIEEKAGQIPLTQETLSVDANPSDRLKHSIDLFSRETVKLIHLCLPSNDLILNCANFIDIISSFYQLMNSTQSAVDAGKTLTSHSRHLEDQSQILSEVQLNFYRLKCPGIERMSEFQKATMMTIESTKMLQHSMKQKHKIEYFAMKHITHDYLKSRLQQLTVSNAAITVKLSPLQVLHLMKQIFIDGYTGEQTGTSKDDEMYKLFFNGSIDKGQSETYYVQQLLDWICEQHKIKHPFSTASHEDLHKRFQKFEETFQTMQNPLFTIVDGPFAKVLKKLKAHTFGMSLDMIQTFVIQRHLLRIKYHNSIDVKIEPSS